LIARIKNKWLRRGAVIAFTPFAFALVFLGFAADAVKYTYDELAPDVANAWRGRS
jgi:hypothetical protein